jgi:hypothetical protein
LQGEQRQTDFESRRKNVDRAEVCQPCDGGGKKQDERHPGEPAQQGNGAQSFVE